MCMSTMNRRLQLLLDEQRYERVAAAAKAQRISVAAVIRDAIDQSLAPGERQRRTAGEAILAAEAMDVPPGDALLEELDALRGRRG